MSRLIGFGRGAEAKADAQAKLVFAVGKIVKFALACGHIIVTIRGQRIFPANKTVRSKAGFHAQSEPETGLPFADIDRAARMVIDGPEPARNDAKTAIDKVGSSIDIAKAEACSKTVFLFHRKHAAGVVIPLRSG